MRREEAFGLKWALRRLPCCPSLHPATAHCPLYHLHRRSIQVGGGAGHARRPTSFLRARRLPKEVTVQHAQSWPPSRWFSTFSTRGGGGCPGEDPQVLSSLLVASASACWAKRPGTPGVPKTYTPSGPALALTTASAQGPEQPELVLDEPLGHLEPEALGRQEGSGHWRKRPAGLAPS